MPTRRFVHGTVSKDYPLIVQVDAMQVDQWLCQVAAHRTRAPLDERLKALLWSWPVRPALTSKSPRPLIAKSHADKETRAHQDEAQRHLAFVASFWYPFSSPAALATDRDFSQLCTVVLGKVSRVANVTSLDRTDNATMLAHLVEGHYGDGELGFRRDQQDILIAPYKEQVQRRICAIAEQARDAAYLAVRTHRMLNRIRTARRERAQFINWLKKVGFHETFVRRSLDPDDPYDPVIASLFDEDIVAGSSAMKTLLAHRDRLLRYLRACEEAEGDRQATLRRAARGRPGTRAWVDTADRALTRLHIPRIQRREFLQVWGLVPLDRS
ncbi:MAG: hypothetical protein MRJ68_12610 [Nitrospira sp.]|nr:hypothetical protein [Nitrospira sp.]